MTTAQWRLSQRPAGVLQSVRHSGPAGQQGSSPHFTTCHYHPALICQFHFQNTPPTHTHTHSSSMERRRRFGGGKVGHQLLGCNLRDRRVVWGLNEGGVSLSPGPSLPQLTTNKWCLHLFWKIKKTSTHPLLLQTPHERAHFQNVTRPDPNNGTCANGAGGRVRGLGGWWRDVNPERRRERSGAVGAPSSSSVTDRSVLGHVSSPPATLYSTPPPTSRSYRYTTHKRTGFVAAREFLTSREAERSRSGGREGGRKNN